MQKVKWGILSTSKFAQTKVIPAMLQCADTELVAVASRDLAKAQTEAQHFGIPKAYGSYEELLADPEIQVVYIPMPNHLHVPWSIKALEAGKHVLCEKPLGLDSADAQRLVDEAKKYPHLKVMEAFMFRLHPQWLRAKEIVKAGGIGQPRTMQSFFSYFNRDENNIRNKADLGGGGLMDIGCYNISFPRFIFDLEPNRVLGLLDIDPDFGTDRIASGVMDFGEISATFTCSTQMTSYQRVNIFGTEGRIEIEIPVNAPPDKPCKMWLQRGTETEEIVFDICDQYILEADAISLAVLNDTPVPTPLEDAVANMKVIEALKLSGKENRWVEIK